MNMEKEYRPREVEQRWIRAWAETDLFHGDPDSGKAPFCMVIPPPNVTGKLHIGHVFVYTLHDIVARWRRLQGRDVLWLPGTDHAGIATQMVVERELAKEGLSRHDLGREAFEKRVWEWKENYGGQITRALRELGGSCDWSRERFTLDDGLSLAVRTVFVRLYESGLIYRGHYTVNWCPRCHTAISDLETEYENVTGRLYTIRYPPAEAGGAEIRVATTRPETLLGDTGVAVHPGDPRYRGAVGKAVQVPLTGRTVPVLADDFVDPQFGTGAVKITPGHDPNDFAAGQRHGLPQLLVIGTDGRMTEAAGAYAGLDRTAARTRIVADLQEGGLLVGSEPYEHAVGHCQRCHTVIEPLASTQWFVKVEPLARRAIAAVEQGRSRFVPSSWSKTYFEWMRNIHDWCISRQLWWGHRIPAWYCDACSETIVAVEPPQACTGCSGPLRQDEDVLDTWFSSGLWPFSTLGWPERTRDLQHYYPTQLMITGHDIIFFWVARMLMLGLEFMDEVPFADIYIHGLVRDAQGRKMSKSKGNTIEPGAVQERYGTDAVRFTMAILAAPGNDIPLAPERMEGYRAFANKLWNATRFVLLQVGEQVPAAPSPARLTLADRWIRSRTQSALETVDRSFEAFRFDQAADALYHVVWHQFCDWYIECVKPALQDGDAGAETARAVLVEVLGVLLRLLHPMMPFITEELWEKLPGSRGLLAGARWPTADRNWRDPDAERDMALLQELVVNVRRLRAEAHIDNARRITLHVHAEDPAAERIVRQQSALLASLVRASEVRLVPTVDTGTIAARGVAGGMQFAVPLEGLLDLDRERVRLGRELERVQKELDARERKLGNPAFVERAPAEVVDKERAIRGELADRRNRLQLLLRQLGGGASRP